MTLDRVEQLLKEITEANGVSGYEEEVRRIMARELDGTVDRIERDKMGSIVGIKAGAGERPRVLVVGHMDEVGFMVKEITEEGFIKFLPLGGWWGHVALGQRLPLEEADDVLRSASASPPAPGRRASAGPATG